MPLVINIALFYLGINYLIDSFGGWLNGFLDRIPDWLGFIQWLLWPLFSVFILLLVAYGFSFAANLIGSPFYGLMAEQVELILTDKPSEVPFTVLSVAAMIPKALLRELQKIMQYILWLMPLLLLSLLSLLITPLSTLMPFVWFAFGAWMLSIQYLDYSYDNHGISFKQLKTDLKQDQNAALGFGGITTVALAIPLLNLFAIPAAVCGGTAYYVERLAEKNPGTALQ